MEGTTQPYSVTHMDVKNFGKMEFDKGFKNKFFFSYTSTWIMTDVFLQHMIGKTGFNIPKETERWIINPTVIRYTCYYVNHSKLQYYKL